jgi:hypothetical protein
LFFFQCCFIFISSILLWAWCSTILGLMPLYIQKNWRILHASN